MAYFPILQELFESDSIVFFAIAAVPALILGLCTQDQKKNRAKLIISLCIYALCEVLCGALYSFRANYMLEFTLLVIGTLSLGAAVGHAVGIIVILGSSPKKHK